MGRSSEGLRWEMALPRKKMGQKGTCTPMFTAALLTTAKTRNNLSVRQKMKMDKGNVV